MDQKVRLTLLNPPILDFEATFISGWRTLDNVQCLKKLFIQAFLHFLDKHLLHPNTLTIINLQD